MKDDLNNLNKPYLGRGIVFGKNDEGVSFVTYILTGRSDSSKARILKFDDNFGVTYTEPTDREKLGEGSPILLLYPAIISVEDNIVVGNGIQTELVHTHMLQFPSFNYPPQVLESSLSRSSFRYDSKKFGFIDIASFEPDVPNYTPRITGCVIGNYAGYAIVRHGKGGKAEKEYKELNLGSMENGQSKLIMTYDGVDTGKEHLHSFAGKPLDLRLTGKDEREISEKVREAINPNTFVAVATQFAIDGRTPNIINLHGE